MFPFQQGNELCFQISPNPNDQHQDLLLHPPNHHRNIRRRSSDNISRNDHTKKKVLHRDIERKRRQEMATLHSSLRSLLPIEYIKGKRSMSDHMHEATNYINHLRKRISELNAQKDELKQQNDLKSVDSQIGSWSVSSQNAGVRIRPCLDGVEIVFITGLKDPPTLTLSRVLQILLQNGVSVVNCVSTTVNERVFHTLNAEVKDPGCVNLSDLQQRLNSFTGSLIQ